MDGSGVSNVLFTLQGPNHTFSGDGHDKLMGFTKSQFPLAIYGLQDVFSCKIVLLKIWMSNSSPDLIGKLYLQHLYETRGRQVGSRKHS